MNLSMAPPEGHAEAMGELRGKCSDHDHAPADPASLAAKVVLGFGVAQSQHETAKLLGAAASMQIVSDGNPRIFHGKE